MVRIKNQDNLELSNMAEDRRLNSLRIRKVNDKMYDHTAE